MNENNYENNYHMDNALENVFEIILTNKTSGVTCNNIPVYGYSTMGDILDAYADELGINDTSATRGKIIFQNKRTEKQTSDLNATMEQMELKAYDVLFLLDNGIVA